MKKRAAVVVSAMMTVLLAAGGHQPVPEPETEPHAGEMKVRKLAAMRYLHLSKKTSFATMGEAVAGMMGPLGADMAAGKVPAGQVVFAYEGVGLGEEFTLKIGVGVKADVKVPEGYAVADEPEYLCAAVVYTGPVAGLAQAWGEMANGIQAEGYVTDHSGREYYLYFESAESPNNVILMASGIKP